MQNAIWKLLLAEDDQKEYQRLQAWFAEGGLSADVKRVSTYEAALDALTAGRLPDDTLPPEHWGHAYCPYLEICEPGQKAMEWQRAQPKSLPDQVLADIIAKRIVAKKGAEAMTTPAKKKPGARSLSDLAKELEWE